MSALPTLSPTLSDPRATLRVVPSVVDAVVSRLARRWKVPVRRGDGIPALLQGIAAAGPVDVLLSAPGVCYHREQHQLDLWRVRVGGEPLGVLDLMEMIDLVVAAVLPGRRWLAQPAEHQYALAGRQIAVEAGDAEIEIGECGLAHREVLRACGLPGDAAGLAMTLDLDRLTALTRAAAASR